jgi:hypothetical protein
MASQVVASAASVRHALGIPALSSSAEEELGMSGGRWDEPRLAIRLAETNFPLKLNPGHLADDERMIHLR